MKLTLTTDEGELIEVFDLNPEHEDGWNLDRSFCHPLLIEEIRDAMKQHGGV